MLSGSNDLVSLFGNYNQISLNILQYLDNEETLDLSLASKTVQSSVNDLVEKNLQDLKTIWQQKSEGASGSLDSEEEEAKIEKEAQQKKKKEKKAKQNNSCKKQNKKWNKKTIFEVNDEEKSTLSSFRPYKPATDPVKFDKEIQDKFFKENQNLYFMNDKTGQLAVINRSIVDPSLNFENEVKEEAEGKYHELHSSEEFDQNKFDFSNPKALLERQKMILENLKQKELAKEAKKLDLIPKLDSLLKIKKATVMLCQGGSFSLGVFVNNKPIFHKSDSKYVVRKKAGKRQISRDGDAGSNIKSIGSQIRRDQEKKHQENIVKILNESYQHIKDSDIIFYHAPGMNKYLILDTNSPIYDLRGKFRSICLTPKKANYTEVERIYDHITKIYFISSVSNANTSV